MNILIGNIPLKDTEKDAVKANILKLIKEKYNFEEEDFRVAELEIVPAGEARDLGLDRSMVIGYGQDDRVCAFTTMKSKIQREQLVDYSWTKKKLVQWVIQVWLHISGKIQ